MRRAIHSATPTPTTTATHTQIEENTGHPAGMQVLISNPIPGLDYTQGDGFAGGDVAPLIHEWTRGVLPRDLTVSNRSLRTPLS
jgi:hypothetical protein